MPDNLTALADERWALDYIPDAATKRVSYRDSFGRIWANDASNYDPCEIGVHLCGQTDDGQQPTTVANYRMCDEAEACDLWEIARNVAECDKGEHDFIVDLVLRDGIVEDFYSNRQLWPRAIEAWNARAKAGAA